MSFTNGFEYSERDEFGDVIYRRIETNATAKARALKAKIEKCLNSH